MIQPLFFRTYSMVFIGCWWEKWFQDNCVLDGIISILKSILVQENYQWAEGEVVWEGGLGLFGN